MKVEATKLGFYNNVRVREGEIFEVKDELFSKNWMKPVEEEEKKPSEKKFSKGVSKNPSNADVI